MELQVHTTDFRGPPDRASSVIPSIRWSKCLRNHKGKNHVFLIQERQDQIAYCNVSFCSLYICKTYVGKVEWRSSWDFGFPFWFSLSQIINWATVCRTLILLRENWGVGSARKVSTQSSPAPRDASWLHRVGPQRPSTGRSCNSGDTEGYCSISHNLHTEGPTPFQLTAQLSSLSTKAEKQLPLNLKTDSWSGVPPRANSPYPTLW